MSINPLRTLVWGLALPIAGIGAASAIAHPHGSQASRAEAESPDWALAIHGGAGTIERANMTAEQDAAYRAALQAALDAGVAVLASGGSAMDAIEAVIVPMEDDPKFNAGRGAVFTWDGTNELDAAVMDGKTRAAGAVTGVKRIRNPIQLARAVMADGRHVFLSGQGAETFALEAGFAPTDASWFATKRRREALERMKADRLSALDVDHKFGTVGAVARDVAGNLAAGTSTGGLTGKRWGRIGDAPIIGAGTYADNRSCAVSATGAGEYFIRIGVAREICSRMRLAGEDAQTAADTVITEVGELGGDGGVIVLAPEGKGVFSINTAGMYRGRAASDGTSDVAIYGDE
ncbi:Beta-aspartyl-peptidase [Alteripontixanthobacter maritimus]|uniref:Isoaspartyl peptidase n=1 Tax=Alteripontixanthobacter maritimus TaxID=2161824 RepID=A0A369Q6N7_9SPHN|nr:isoaspartyl peptidase/L-asparaginase [Alteripontixanthobacter maritimus]RDC60531.1 Beta-aspartyl-peptidase [Alteripontixanthobacter maritimus]